ncbi:hypothetical protein ACMYSN_02915 [Klebsiella sp. R445]
MLIFMAVSRPFLGPNILAWKGNARYQLARKNVVLAGLHRAFSGCREPLRVIFIIVSLNMSCVLQVAKNHGAD